MTATSDTPLAGIEFTYSFDPTKLQVASIVPAGGWSTINCAPEGDPTECLVQVDNTLGTVRAVYFRIAPDAPVSGTDLPIASITFNAIAAASATDLDLTSAILSNVDGGSVEPVGLVDSSSLEIEPAAPSTYIISGTVQLQGRIDHSGTTVLFGGLSATTSATGAFSITVDDGTEGALVALRAGYLRAVSGELTISGDLGAGLITLDAGDANGDGAISIFDLALIAGNYGQSGPFSLGDGSLTPVQAITPDVNGSGGVDLFDLTLAAGNYGATTPAAWSVAP